jgi:hypothetical protein
MLKSEVENLKSDKELLVSTLRETQAQSDELRTRLSDEINKRKREEDQEENDLKRVKLLIDAKEQDARRSTEAANDLRRIYDEMETLIAEKRNIIISTSPIVSSSSITIARVIQLPPPSQRSSPISVPIVYNIPEEDSEDDSD